MAVAELYRCRTRTNWLCPCGRVARELDRRGYDVTEHRVARDDREAIEALTGQTRVPVLVVDRDVVCDSRRIVEHLRWRAGDS